MPRVSGELHGTPDMSKNERKLLKYLEGRFRSETREETNRRMAEWCLSATSYIERRQSISFVKDFEDWDCLLREEGWLEQSPLSVN